MSHSNLRATVRLATFLFVTGGLLPLYILAFPFGRRARRLFSYPFYRSCVFLTGLEIHISGARSAETGTLFVANHASYLDIPVLATLADGLFVAKSEVQGWPLFGFLARISRTVFIDRRVSRVAHERLAIAARLALGDSIFLFPEGSSSDGTGVLPFRPGLLSAALMDEELDVTIQPVSIVYGPALSGRDRDCYTWYGDMDLAPHLWRVFGLAEKIVVAVNFHSTRLSGAFADRRDLARWAEQTVAEGMDHVMKEAKTSAYGPIDDVRGYELSDFPPLN